jgi:hypothetical protein
VAGGLVHVVELGAVFERRRDECRAHRVRRVAAIEAELAGVVIASVRMKCCTSSQ